jgi:hypothetical protein
MNALASMQKDRTLVIANTTLLVAMIVASIVTFVKLTTATALAMPGAQTGINMSGTNTANSTMHMQLCTSSYPCANSTNSTTSK